MELAVRCGCSRAACGHPLGCAGVTQPNVAVGNSELAMCAPRGDATHAPAARSTVEVAREPRLRQLPPRHAHRRRGGGRPNAVRAARGEGEAGGAHACAARRTAEVGGAPDEPHRARRSLRLLPRCVWPSAWLRRRDAAECRRGELRAGHVRAAGGRHACSRSQEHRGGRARTSTASTAAAPRSSPSGWRTSKRCARRAGGRGGGGRACLRSQTHRGGWWSARRTPSSAALSAVAPALRVAIRLAAPA